MPRLNGNRTTRAPCAAAFLRCWMGDHIVADGWYPMGYNPKGGGRAMMQPEEARFHEFESAGPGVEVLATHQGHAVAAREDRVLVTAFHPELTGDTRMHDAFLSMVRAASSATAATGARAGAPTGEVVT